MPRARAPPGLLAAAAVTAAAAILAAVAAEAPENTYDDILYNITEEEFFEMPTLFELDEWEGCLATRGVYCVGTFQLAPLHPGDQDISVKPLGPAKGYELYERMRRYSLNWVDNYNHTLLHRGYCLTRRCPKHGPHPRHLPYETWFSSCVNESTVSEYGLTARTQELQSCALGPVREPPPTSAHHALLAVTAALLVITAFSTVLDMMLSDQAKKGAGWQCALSWSVLGCWRALTGRPPAPAGSTDLSPLDGLRVFCVICVVIEHVCWITAQAFIDNVWQFEQFRHDLDVMLMINSTLVVQVFFLMSSFLLAHKLLQQRRAPHKQSSCGVFVETLVNRIIRVSPSYFMAVWFAASWWERVGSGPLWPRLVSAEAAICRRKWWTHLLYLNNILYADDKCLIQTWYLAADMQLYVVCLALTLALRRCGVAALGVLSALTAAAIAVPLALAYLWRLSPTYVMHRPELVRNIYNGESSFNVLYQSPVSNAAGALAGLLLAHLHHHLLDTGVQLKQRKWFRVLAVWSPLLSVLWAMLSPALLGRGPPNRVAAAVLAATERPIFSFFVAAAMLGAMHGIDSPLRRALSWRGWVVLSRLSFGVLLLHMPFNKAVVASRLSLSRIDRQVAFVEAFGVAAISFLAAIPLALLVELPAQRLHRALRQLLSGGGKAESPAHTSHPATAKSEGAPLQDQAKQ